MKKKSIAKAKGRNTVPIKALTLKNKLRKERTNKNKRSPVTEEVAEGPIERELS